MKNKFSRQEIIIFCCEKNICTAGKTRSLTYWFTRKECDISASHDISCTILALRAILGFAEGKYHEVNIAEGKYREVNIFLIFVASKFRNS